MYSLLITLHSLFRWFVLSGLLYSVFRAYQGYRLDRTYTKLENGIRYWTVTFSHIQLAIGFSLYFSSPLIRLFFSDLKKNIHDGNFIFFGIYHILLMTSSVVFITIGSALSKRKSIDKEKFKTTFIWFSIALFLIFISIPWPFSPFANRPYLRGYSL